MIHDLGQWRARRAVLVISTLALLLAACTTQQSGQAGPSSTTVTQLSSPPTVPTSTQRVLAPTVVAQSATPALAAAQPSATPVLSPAQPSATSGAVVPPIVRGLPTATPGPNGAIPTATPIPGAKSYHGDALFAYTDNGNIFTYDSKTGQPHQLTNVDPGDWATDPAWSPDGKSIVYSLQVAPKPGQMTYADLMLMNPDGSNPHILIAHDDQGAILERPVWSSDGKTLYFAYSKPIFENGKYKDVLQEISSAAVAGGPRKTVVPNATDPSIDKSGKHIIYYDNVTNDLYMADIGDPAHTAKLMLRQDDYALVYAPRLSPDGNKIVFISAGAGMSMGGSLPPGSTSGKLASPLASLHGLPVDLWMLDVASGKAVAITKYLLDSPFPTWSGDGKQLAFISANGVYVLNPDGSNLEIVSPMSLHGEIAWAPR